MSGLKGMSIIGFGCKHQIKDTDGKIHKFSQTYKYIKVYCPKCKEINSFLYPTINECNKCHCIIAFCSLNDGENKIRLTDIKKFQADIDAIQKVEEGKK